MAKIDDVLASLEVGFKNPRTMLYRVTVEDKFMNQLQVRRQQAGLTHHRLWCLSLGETGEDAYTETLFYGHRPSDCIKKAQTRLGLPTVTRRKKVAEK